MKRLATTITVYEFIKDGANLYSEYFLTNAKEVDEDSFILTISINKGEVMDILKKNFKYPSIVLNETDLYFDISDYIDYIEELMVAYDKQYGENNYDYEYPSKATLNWNEVMTIKFKRWS